MSDNITTLSSLITALRPWKPMHLSTDEVDVHLYARKPSAGEQAEISSEFARAYQEKRSSLGDADESELVLFRRSLKMQKADVLADYVTSADEAQFLEEAQSLTEKGPDHKDTKKKVAELTAERKQQLIEGDFETLVNEALERREHIQAMIHATKSIVRLTVVVCTYNEAKERLFSSVEESYEMPEGFIDELSRGIDKALGDVKKKDSPLKPAPSPA